MEEYFIEMTQCILTMTFTGSIVSIFLFAIKPIIKDKLPKSFQYYIWFPVVMALILPLSKIVVPPVGSSAAPIRSIHDITQWISDTAFEKPVDFASTPQPGNGQIIPQTSAHFPGIAALIYIFWQTGMILFLDFHLICYVLYVRKLKKYNICAGQQEMELLNELSGSRKTPRLYKNSVVAAPVLIGLFRPMIILPQKKYEDRKLQSVLLHEITHTRKYDIAIKWLLIYVGALHWFNPMIYFVRREIGRACELACDEAVIRKFDNEGKQHYGDTLIMVAADTIRKTPFSVTMFEDKRNLKERLDAIMKHKDFPKKTIYLSCLLLIVIICGTFYLGTARSSTNPKSGGAVAYADEDPMQRQRHLKEIQVRQVLRDYDKDNILDVSAYLDASDHEFTSAYIYVVSKDEITDVEEQDKIKAVASVILNLDAQNIDITYVDSKTLSANPGNDGAGEDPAQRQRQLKEIEVAQALRDYDKDNILDVDIYLKASDHEFTSAYIYVVSKDEITDAAKQDKIKAVASGLLNLDAQNVEIAYIAYMDDGTISVQGIIN